MSLLSPSLSSILLRQKHYGRQEEEREIFPGSEPRVGPQGNGAGQPLGWHD
jgi:hypothetical protein